VDPYFVLTFAGNAVESVIKESNASPEWNEVLKLGVQFPSLCDRLTLQIFDWDQLGVNDPIATAYVMINQISAPGEEKFSSCSELFVSLFNYERIIIIV
jgi:Ca2+-dependent lipid-binding protein